MSNIVDKVFDNSEDGKPNYAIDLVDGTRLYYRGKVMNPMPQSGDAINFTVINVKMGVLIMTLIKHQQNLCLSLMV
jgi:hypothetical protein